MSRGLYTTIAIRIVMVAVVAVLLVGCGKKGNPQPPPGQPNVYPKQYPSS
jgi:hypothetical protein